MIRLVFSLVLSLLLSSSLSAQEKVNWLSWDEALKKNKSEPRPFMVDFYTVWCGPCRMMNKNTFGDAEVAAYLNEHYYAIKFNAQGKDTVELAGYTLVNRQYDPKRARSRNGTHDLTMAMAAVNGSIAYPTVVFLNEKLEIITPVQGYIKANDFRPILHFIAEDAYLREEYAEFLESFQSGD